MSETPETDAEAITPSGFEADEVSAEFARKLERERNEVQEKYDTLAVENMLEVNKICKQRDDAIDALIKIEEIFINGCDTYEDWKSMGQIAKTFLEKTYESRTNQTNQKSRVF